MKFKVQVEKARSGRWVEILNWRNFNFDGIRKDLTSVLWDRLFSGKGVLGNWEAFRSEFLTV